MDSVVIKDLVDSTVEVFSKMISMQLVVDPEVKREEAVQRCQITGMVGLAGKSMGILSVHCTPKMGMAITSNMLGTNVPEMNDDVKDAIGEVTNMVAGNFKTKMSKNGELFDLSVPTVIVGERYTTRTMTDTPTIVLEFSWSDEKIYVKLNFKG